MKELEKYVNEIYNKQAKEYIENALSYVSKEKIKLPDGENYLTMFAEVYKTDEEIMQDEIDELQQRIDKAIEYIRSNEWAKDYEISNCRTHLLEILGDK